MIRWIVVGLGNPGKQYQRSRHNAGFLVVKRLKEELGIRGWGLEKKFFAEVAEGNGVLLMKPQTFMNDSGKAISAAVRFYKIPLDHLIVVHDDLDIPLGVVKAGLEKGPKVHNGLESIEQQLGSKAFWRVRVGVDNRVPSTWSLVPSKEYVLMPMTSDEMNTLGLGLELAVTKVMEIME